MDDYIQKIVEHKGDKLPLVLPATKIAREVYRNEQEINQFNYINAMIQRHIDETMAKIEETRERLRVADSFKSMLDEKYTQLQKVLEEARKVKTLTSAKEILASEDILSKAAKRDILRKELIKLRGQPKLQRKLDKAHELKQKYKPKPKPKKEEKKEEEKKPKSVLPTPTTPRPAGAETGGTARS